MYRKRILIVIAFILLLFVLRFSLNQQNEFNNTVAQAQVNNTNLIEKPLDFSPEKTVKLYYQFAKEGNLAELLQYTVLTPDSFWEYRLQKARQKLPPKTQSGSPRYLSGRPGSSGMNEIFYKVVTKSIPSFIQENKLDIQEITEVSTKGSESRIRIRCASNEYPDLICIQDVFLVKEINGNWKIFRIQYPEVSQTYPM